MQYGFTLALLGNPSGALDMLGPLAEKGGPPELGKAVEQFKKNLQTADGIAAQARAATAKTPADYLQNDWYDEFVLQARLPSKAGMLYWPVSQICEEGKVDWVEVPKPGQKMSDFKNPAAALELMPAGGGGEHNH